jgi:hypothetical protein
MTAGYDVTLAGINSRAGQLTVALRDALDDIHRYQGQVMANADGFFTGLGMSAGDLTVLRAAMTDLDKLYQVAHALTTQSPASDFFFSAKNLCGVL